jgi:hypothetical protein
MLHGCLLPPSCTFTQCNMPDALTLHWHYCKHLESPHHANVTSWTFNLRYCASLIVSPKYSSCHRTFTAEEAQMHHEFEVRFPSSVQFPVSYSSPETLTCSFQADPAPSNTWHSSHLNSTNFSYNIIFQSLHRKCTVRRNSIFQCQLQIIFVAIQLHR